MPTRASAPNGAHHPIQQCLSTIRLIFESAGSIDSGAVAESDPKYHGTTRYYEITQNSRIVSSETIDVDGHRLFVSLTTLDLSPSGAQTELKTTVQLASFVGAEMVKGHEDGHNGSLNNLVRFFATR